MAKGRGEIFMFLAGEPRRIEVQIPAKWREKWGAPKYWVNIINRDPLPVDMHVWIDEDSGEVNFEVLTPKPKTNGESHASRRSSERAEHAIPE
jgi:hypothetical protein